MLLKGYWSREKLKKNIIIIIEAFSRQTIFVISSFKVASNCRPRTESKQDHPLLLDTVIIIMFYLLLIQ